MTTTKGNYVSLVESFSPAEIVQIVAMTVTDKQIKKNFLDVHSKLSGRRKWGLKTPRISEIGSQKHEKWSAICLDKNRDVTRRSSAISLVEFKS